MRAYVVLKIVPQKTTQVMHDLKNEDHIITASLVHGPYDCIIEIEGNTLEDINETVLRIRTIEGIEDSSTSLVVQSWHRPLE